MIEVGFTGTKKGMTFEQKVSLQGLAFWSMYHDTIECVHHGDCVGADQQFHDFCAFKYDIIVHPPLNNKFRAYCTVGLFVFIREPKDYLERNEDIVNCSDYLIATPRLMTEEIRSGTWHAIRYARKQGKPIYIIWPDGTIKYEINEREYGERF